MTAPRTTTAPQRTFWCFISYRHADNKEPGRQWASWLHHAMETYEVPSDLVGTTNERGDVIPERIYPVFRDEEELPVDADLATPIFRALDASKFLLVICSPNAVESPYVAQEISYFKQLGREDRVLAAMIDGEPNASTHPRPGKVECFPEPLRFCVDSQGKLQPETAEPIAADFRLDDGSQGWCSPEAYRQELKVAGKLSSAQMEQRVNAYNQRCELMKLKIIAGVLGIPLGTLTQRDKAYQLELSRKRARRLRQWLAAVAVLGLLAVAGAIIARQQTKIAREKTIVAQQQTELAQQQTQLAEQETIRAEAQTKIATENLGLAKSRLAGNFYQDAARLTQGPAGQEQQALLALLDSLDAEPKNGPAQRLFDHIMATRSWVVPEMKVTTAGELSHAWLTASADRALTLTKRGVLQEFDLIRGKMTSEADITSQLPKECQIEAAACNPSLSQIALLCKVPGKRRFDSEFGDFTLDWSWRLLVISREGKLIGSDALATLNKDQNCYVSSALRANRLADQPLFYVDESLLLFVSQQEIAGWNALEKTFAYLGAHKIPVDQDEEICGWEYIPDQHRIRFLTNRQIFQQHVSNGVVASRRIFTDMADPMFPRADEFSGMVSFGDHNQAAISGVVDASFQLPEGVGVGLSTMMGESSERKEDSYRYYSGVCQFTENRGWIHFDDNMLVYSHSYDAENPDSDETDFSVTFPAENRATEWPPLLIRDLPESLLMLSTMQSGSASPQLLELVKKPSDPDTLHDTQHQGISQILDGRTCWIDAKGQRIAQVQHDQLVIYRIGWRAPAIEAPSLPAVARPFSFGPRDMATVGKKQAPAWGKDGDRLTLALGEKTFTAPVGVNASQWAAEFPLEKSRVRMQLFRAEQFQLEANIMEQDYEQNFLLWVLHEDTGESQFYGPLRSFSVDTEESLLAIADGVTVSIKSLSDGKELRTFRPKRSGNHMTAPANEVAFSIDPHVIAVGSLSSVQDYATDYRAFDAETGCEFMLDRGGRALWYFDLFPQGRSHEIQEWSDGKKPAKPYPFFLSGYGREIGKALAGQETTRSVRTSSKDSKGLSRHPWSIVRWPEFAP